MRPVPDEDNFLQVPIKLHIKHWTWNLLKHGNLCALRWCCNITYENKDSRGRRALDIIRVTYSVTFRLKARNIKCSDNK